MMDLASYKKYPWPNLLPTTSPRIDFPLLDRTEEEYPQGTSRTCRVAQSLNNMPLIKESPDLPGNSSGTGAE
jgi:hypothetical protein